MKEEFKIIDSVISRLNCEEMNGSLIIIGKDNNIRIGSNVNRYQFKRMIIDVYRSLESGSEIELFSSDSDRLN